MKTKVCAISVCLLAYLGGGCATEDGSDSNEDSAVDDDTDDDGTDDDDGTGDDDGAPNVTDDDDSDDGAPNVTDDDVAVADDDSDTDDDVAPNGADDDSADDDSDTDDGTDDDGTDPDATDPAPDTPAMDSETDVEPEPESPAGTNCAKTAAQNLALATELGCNQDPDLEANCEGLYASGSCVSQWETLISCFGTFSADDFQCNEENELKPKPTSCQAEREGFDACIR